jgi:streptomycin 6-kinase
MEQIDPGTRLDRTDLSFDLVHAIVNVLRRIDAQPAPVSDMRRIDQWLRERLDDDQLTDLAPGRLGASVAERQQALRVLDHLSDQPDRQNLCHGDLHPGNVLVRADGRLFLIDPRGVSGEVAYDVAVLALKAVRGAPAAARAVAVQLSTCVGVDPQRVQAWVRVASAARV